MTNDEIRREIDAQKTLIAAAHTNRMMAEERIRAIRRLCPHERRVQKLQGADAYRICEVCGHEF